ncbi:DUF4178 domain-containing protein [Plantactinospora endophytica]|uniref:DUF4178 domain-containing protein n=1 Tax=Plantactinospora endophytica TaxID=673535 RepID=A0ABQ4DY23_9ACTN|nr:DUF4178 domain-containing protein [Plantactinospora endophytica]GIG87342.1 hypothetical protein Pen02_22780 [Plantactinospora endophytica]
MNGATAYLVAAAGCLIAVAGVVVAVLALRAGRRRTARAPGAPVRDPFRSTDDDADALRGDPRTLKPGDLVEIRHTSYGVRGTLRFSEGAWGWTEHLLDDAHGTRLWLSVEEDPDLELVLWTAVPETDVAPGPVELDFGGRRYRRDESGQARFTATGSTGLDPTGTVRYYDYVSADGSPLSFEAYGDSERWEVGTGERLHRAEVLIYPQATDGADDQATGRVG